MTNENESPAPEASQPIPTDPTPAAQGGEPGGAKKRRRRRRGKRRSDRQPGAEGPRAENQAGIAAAPPPQQHPRSEQPPRPNNQPNNQHRDRGERGGHPSHRGGHDRSPRADEARHDGSADENPVQPRPARAKLPPSNEHWEEIFEGKSFAELGLRSSVLKGIEAAGFTNPTKIQSELIPLMIAGKDILGQSRTGTGKTAAFGLPLYQCAVRDVPFQSLILAPTRELAIQIASELQELGKFTPIRISAVFGGQAVHTQARNLERGPEIIVATPGRLMDMVERGHINLNSVRFAVLDEVDRMLDIGFRDDIKKILGSIKHPHQTVFVSATISPEIEKLARTYMKDPEKLVTTGGSLTVSLVEQHYVAVEPWDKRSMLRYVLTHEEPDLTVVFCRTKRTVDELARYLTDKGIDAHPMHGDMYQGKRNSVMKRLREGQLGVLVASDLAARGLDVDGISHVVNYDLPEDPEVYIHRIGRTARAGRRGVAWSLVTPDQGELLTAIEMLANTHIPEKKYPDFKPGPVPTDVRARREYESKTLEAKRTINRAAPPSLPAAASNEVKAPIDASKFPGGIIPTKLPPRMLGGRVKTSRSMRSNPLPVAAPPPPAEKP
ncbi:MAG: DEAD/DEAH box helicase [Phycisphaerae bacterium]|nr:DEAD/DEAH box helicase [Phycisphaerae bacterium]